MSSLDLLTENGKSYSAVGSHSAQIASSPIIFRSTRSADFNPEMRTRHGRHNEYSSTLFIFTPSHHERSRRLHQRIRMLSKSSPANNQFVGLVQGIEVCCEPPIGLRSSAVAFEVPVYWSHKRVAPQLVITSESAVPSSINTGNS
jgi:hypothetical protein